MTPVLSVYRPGTTLLHRLPAGPKLAALFGYGVFVVWLSGPWPTVTTVGVSLAMALSARLPLRDLVGGLRPFAIMAALIVAFQWWQRGWPVAVEVAATVLALVIAAVTFTATTRVDAMLDALVRGLGPFRRIGVRPERVALTISLTLTSIPRIAQIAAETRDAARARGIERSPRAWLTPMAIRAVAHAHHLGDALAARGLDD
ncbi:MAG: energy-coupling factor transporter transmembrane protein EcfT [Aeromicrobium sp.]|uniref:energy-coupling factor transporter transmembrane component T family protein n=1 Tax=Aeromicrobium sp. TaxID=1871063 RepID=UPI0039E32261